MNCKEARRYLHERADGSLEPAGSRRLDRHLSRCPVCDSHALQLEELYAAARCLAIDPGNDLVMAILEKIEVPPRTVFLPPPGRIFLRFDFLTVHLVLAAGIWISVLRWMGSPEVSLASPVGLFGGLGFDGSCFEMTPPLPGLLLGGLPGFSIPGLPYLAPPSCELSLSMPLIALVLVSTISFWQVFAQKEETT